MRRFISLVLSLLLLPVLQTAAQEKLTSVCGLQFTVPSTWKPITPSSPMRAGQWTISNSKLGEAEIVLFYFGDQQGGDIASNLERWKSQVTTLQGAPAASEITSTQINQLKMTRIALYGTYAGNTVMPGIPAFKQTNFGLVGVIIEGPQGNLFLRVTGPEALIKAQLPVLEKFITSFKNLTLNESKKAS